MSEEVFRQEDIKELADQGLRTVWWSSADSLYFAIHFRDRMKYDNEQKLIIAKKVLQFLKEGQVVIL